MNKQEFLTISKITRPKLSQVIERKRLFKLLDAARGKPVIWLSAPAGSGKTTLAAGYLDYRKPPCLWYQVDEGDADLSTFFYYMGLAAKKAAPGYKKPLPLLTPEYLADIPTFTKRWFENLFGRLAGRSGSPGRPCALVLDNYQDAPVDSRFHEMIVNGLDVIPDGVNIIIISRSEPPARFSRLLANNKISRIGWEEIKFNFEETAEFVAAAGEQSKQTALTLHKQADGWVAGMVLMMESGKGGFEARSYMTNHEAVFNYFVAEIFNKADKETQDFLLKTSFLPDMIPGMTKRLTGVSHAEKILSGLNKNNYFCQKIVGAGFKLAPTYRYHPLFREFLQAKARGGYSPEELADILLSAAETLEEEGNIEAAAKLYCARADHARLAPLIMRYAHTLMAQGRNGVLEQMLSSIPDKMLQRDPHLLYIAGICRLSFNPIESRSLLERSFDLLKKKKDYPAAIMACGSILESIVIESGSYKAVDPYIDWLNRLVKKRTSSIASAEKIAGVVLFALAFRDLNHPALPLWLQKAEAATAKASEAPTTPKLCNYLMAYYLFRGEFNKITHVLKIVEPFKKEAEAAPALQCLCLLLEAYHAVYVTADIGAGIAYARRGLDIARASGITAYNFWFSYLITIASINTGDLKTTRESLDKLRSEWRSAPAIRAGDIYMLSGRFAMGCGEWREAAEHFRIAVDIFEKAGCRFSAAFHRVALAHACFECGDKRDAERHVLAAAKGNWMNSWMITYQGLAARAYFTVKSGDRKKAHALLRESFGIARKHSLKMFPLWNRAATAMLCAEALDAGIETDFVRELIPKYRLTPPNPPRSPSSAEKGMGGVENWPYPVKIYTFGRFEIERDGKPLEFSGKVQKKPLELLKAIIAFGSSGISEERIIDALWPEARGDSAAHSFDWTLKRLKKLLGEKLLRTQDGKLYFDENRCWSDASAFESLAARLETIHVAARGKRRLSADETLTHERLMTRALAVYRGEFLAGEPSSSSWLYPYRERTRNRFLKLLSTAGEISESAGDFENALSLYQRALHAHELREDIHRGIMRCHLRLGRPAEAVAAYKRCRAVLASNFGTSPSQETENLYRSIYRAS